MNRGYLVYYITMVVIGFLFVAGVGAYAGPAHLLSKHYEEGIADILISGNNVGNAENYDMGVVQKYYVSKLTDRKEVIVIGSSRSMGLRDYLFPGRSFFNNSIIAASLGDYFAIFELYEEKGLIPSVVVLGLDPYILDKSFVEIYNNSLRQQYISMAERLNVTAWGGPASTITKGIGITMSVPYFIQSLRNLFLHSDKYFPTKDRPDVILKLADGSLLLPQSYVNRSPDDVEASAILFAQAGYLADFTELDKGRMKSLEAFVDYMHSKNVVVIFYLPPYHPSAYNIFVNLKHYNWPLQAEEYFREMARDKGIPVVGSYDPQKSSSTREDFYDAVHPKESSIHKAFSKLDCTSLANCHVVESLNP
jgi:hypothetical protein